MKRYLHLARSYKRKYSRQLKWNDGEGLCHIVRDNSRKGLRYGFSLGACMVNIKIPTKPRELRSFFSNDYGRVKFLVG
jgi:hypothetical protein